jgi:large-conductance mechanosensitive channel
LWCSKKAGSSSRCWSSSTGEGGNVRRIPEIHQAVRRDRAGNRGEQHFLIGPILNALINFLIVAWLVFLFAKKVLREETVSKK